MSKKNNCSSQGGTSADNPIIIQDESGHASNGNEPVDDDNSYSAPHATKYSDVERANRTTNYQQETSHGAWQPTGRGIHQFASQGLGQCMGPPTSAMNSTRFVSDWRGNASRSLHGSQGIQKPLIPPPGHS